MLPLKSYIHNPNIIGITVLQKLFWWIPDSLYLRLLYRLNMGHRLDLSHPTLFSEKIQWLKLYERLPKYTIMVDKLAVKEYVTKQIGEEYVIKTLGEWKCIEDIKWDALPDNFVIKNTKGGGAFGVLVCKDKTKLDFNSAERILSRGLKQNIYRDLREWPYKNVPMCFFAEEYIESEDQTGDLKDYKWYCFNGEPKYCQVIQNRTSKETIDFFDTEWNHMEFVGLTPGVGNADKKPSRPVALSNQIEIARKLSEGIPFIRVDLYEVKGRIYFGELTFYPASGMGVFTPEKYDRILGTMLDLPMNKK